MRDVRFERTPKLTESTSPPPFLNLSTTTNTHAVSPTSHLISPFPFKSFSNPNHVDSYRLFLFHPAARTIERKLKRELELTSALRARTSRLDRSATAAEQVLRLRRRYHSSSRR